RHDRGGGPSEEQVTIIAGKAEEGGGCTAAARASGAARAPRPASCVDTRGDYADIVAVKVGEVHFVVRAIEGGNHRANAHGDIRDHPVGRGVDGRDLSVVAVRRQARDVHFI